MESNRQRAKRSGYAGLAAVAVALGLTELFAGLSKNVPSAMSAIGGIVIDLSPSWLKNFAISVFGTQDKVVLGISVFAVCLLVGYFLGKRSVNHIYPILIGFVLFGIAGMAAQMGEPNAEAPAAVASTLIAMGVGLGVFVLLERWFTPTPASETDDDWTDVGRRRVLLGLVGAAAFTVVSVGVGRAMLRSKAEAQRASLILPNPVESMPDPTMANDFGIDGVTPVVVGNATFYRIDTALVTPAIDPDEWTLRIHGMVDREVELSYVDIQQMPQIERYATLSCVSNEVGGRLVGNALWTGVLLKDILDMAGVKGGADQLVGRSVDNWTSGFPTEYAFDDREAMLAIGMNREILPANHGFPARIVVPGLYGYVSATKWITEIELTTWDAFDGYWIPRGWAKEGPVVTQSRIDTPKPGSRVRGGADFVFGGVAWAPNIGVDKVELSVDGGPWLEAEVADPLSKSSWVLWKLDYDLPAGKHDVMVRATDATGYTQTDALAPPAPSGATGWHTVSFSAS
jgi:DMSO/TMAO reductase YedYZ molybdopterin-dependent catalytic subunit